MLRCSGTMAPGDHGHGVEEVDIGFLPSRLVALCSSCRDAAGRMGMIDRRKETPVSNDIGTPEDYTAERAARAARQATRREYISRDIPAVAPTRDLNHPGAHPPAPPPCDNIFHAPHVPEQVMDLLWPSPDPREDALTALAEVEQALESYNEFQRAWARVGAAMKELHPQEWLHIEAYPGWTGTRDAGAGLDVVGWIMEADSALREVYTADEPAHSPR